MSAAPPASPARAPGFFSTQIRTGRRFYLDLGRRRRGQLSVVAGGLEVCTPAYVIERKDFPFLAIELVVAGHGWVELRGEKRALGPGAVCSYGPGVAHRIWCDPASPLQKYFVTFHGGGARRMLDQADLAPGRCREAPRAANLRAIWEELLRAGARAQPQAEADAELALRFLISVLGDGQRAHVRNSGAQTTIDRCEAFMQQHFLEIRTVKEVAAACRIDVPYLCRLGRRFLGQTPFQYLQRLQMGWAAERLQADKLVREVAEELAMDPFQFSRTFKRVYGVSPTEFQQLDAR